MIEDLVLKAAGDLDATRVLTNKGKVIQKAIEFEEIEGAKGKYGIFGIEEDGSWSYKLKNTLDGVQSLAQGEVVKETFRVVTETGAVSYVVINVVGTNDIPVMAGQVTGALIEDGAVNVATGQILVSDVDHGQSSVQIGLQAGNYGSFSIDASGNWAYTLDNASANTQGLAAGQVVTETFKVLSLDGSANLDVTVTITGTNDAPQVTSAPQIAAVIEDSVLLATGQVIANDVDTGAVLTYSGNATGAYGGFAVDPSTGQWVYNLNNNVAQNLAAGETRTEIFTVTVADEQGATATQDVTITITGTNDAPLITSGIQVGSAVEDNVPITWGQVTAGDVDHGAVLAYSGNADGLYGSFAVDSATGLWRYDLGAAAQALGAGEVVHETFTVTVADEHGATATQDVTVTVTGVNDVAVIAGETTGAVTEDSATSYSGTLTIADADAGQSSFVAATGLAGQYGTLSINAAGQWTYFLDNSAAAVQALNTGETLTDAITVTSLDGTAQQIGITINGTNDASACVVDFNAAPGEYNYMYIGGGQSYSGFNWSGNLYTFPGQETGYYNGFRELAAQGGGDIAYAYGGYSYQYSSGYYNYSYYSDYGHAGTSFSATNGADFKFEGISMAAGMGGTGTVTLSGYNNGVLVGEMTVAVNNWSVTDAAPTDWGWVDNVTITSNIYDPSNTYSYSYSGYYSYYDYYYGYYYNYAYYSYSYGASWHYLAFDNMKYQMANGDPIVIDLGNNGADFVQGANVAFDMNADGFAENTGWVGATDGILVVDLNHSGAIENGTEVVADHFNGFGFGNSMEALRSLDANLDGVVDNQDTMFSELQVWRDANSDGITQAGELLSMADLGIQSISVKETAVSQTVNGQSIFATGTLAYADGSTGTYFGANLNPVDATVSSNAAATAVKDIIDLSQLSSWGGPGAANFATVAGETGNTVAMSGALDLTAANGDVIVVNASVLSGFSGSNLGIATTPAPSTYSTLGVDDVVNGLVATANHAQFVYDGMSGSLWFDGDGAGSGQAVLITVLGGAHPATLAAENLVVFGA